jgi:hypothetical protein
VRNEAGIFYVLRKDRPCFFAGGFVGHNVFILSKMMRPDIPHPKVISSKLSLGNEYSIPSQGLCPNWDRIAATKFFHRKTRSDTGSGSWIMIIFFLPNQWTVKSYS